MFVFQAPVYVRLEMLSADIIVDCFSMATHTCYIIYLFIVFPEWLHDFLCLSCTISMSTFVELGRASEEYWNITYLLNGAALIV